MNTRKKHILLTTAWWPTATNTSGVFVKEQGEALSRDGHKVTALLITYSTLGTLLKQGKTAFESSREVDVMHLHTTMRIAARIYSNPQAKFKALILRNAEKWMYAYIAKKGKPDVIHHHCLSDNAFVARHLSEKFGIPYVFTEHSNYFTYEELNKFNRFESYDEHLHFVRGACARIGVSEIRARGYEKIFGVSFQVVSNLVHDTFAGPLTLKKKESPFRFVCVAILDKRKRQDLLIRAFASVFRGQNILLDLVGPGKAEGEYRTLINALKIQDQVRILGKKNRIEVRDIFDASHACVLSSDQETFGVVLAEAMFRGLPVISTVCGGPEEIVNPTVGLLVEKGNESAYASAMKQLAENYINYDATAIRSYAESRFSEKIIVAQLEEIYANCTP